MTKPTERTRAPRRNIWLSDIVLEVMAELEANSCTGAAQYNVINHSYLVRLWCLGKTFGLGDIPFEDLEKGMTAFSKRHLADVKQRFATADDCPNVPDVWSLRGMFEACHYEARPLDTRQP